MRSVSPLERDPAKFAEALNHLTRKRSGEVTLTAGATTTVVTDPTVETTSTIRLVEQTTNAAAAKYTAPYCIITAAKGSFTVTHANNGQTDRTFRWIAGD